jgi:hypothetical protein
MALIACGLIIAPHVAWLYHNHFPTISYAASRAGQTHGVAFRLLAPLRFLLTQLVDVSPALLVAAVAGFLARECIRQFSPDDSLRFLWLFTIGPALLTALLSLVSGLGLRDMWGAPMWDLAGLLIVYACRPRWAKVRWTRLAICIGAAFILQPLAYVVSTSIVPTLQGKPSRTQWPDHALAKTFDKAYFGETGRPLRIVAADGWLGGLIAMGDPSRPSVYTDANMQESPWITPARLAREGALVLWRADRPVPRRLLAMQGLKVIGSKSFAWPDVPAAHPLVVGWGIVPALSQPTRKAAL